MAQGDQVARPLGRHDPRQPGDLEHIPLRQPTVPDQLERRRLHPHAAAGPRRPSVISLPETSTIRLAPVSSKCVSSLMIVLSVEGYKAPAPRQSPHLPEMDRGPPVRPLAEPASIVPTISFNFF